MSPSRNTGYTSLLFALYFFLNILFSVRTIPVFSFDYNGKFYIQ
jgi:hypothetical protein